MDDRSPNAHEFAPETNGVDHAEPHSPTQSKFGLSPLFSSSSLRWNGLLLERFVVPAAESNFISTSGLILHVQRERGAFMEIREGKNVISQPLSANAICITPAGWQGWLSLSEPASYLSLRFTPEAFCASIGDGVQEKHLEILAQRGLQDPPLLAICLALEHEARTNGETGRLYADSLATALVARILRLHSTFPISQPQYKRGLSKSARRNVTDYIQANLSRNLSLTELANVAQISPFHFARLFRQSLGMPPHQYLIQQRIEAAKKLLRNHRLAIADICREVGYESQSHFTSVFRKLTGVTPKTFRSGI